MKIFILLIVVSIFVIVSLITFRKTLQRKTLLENHKATSPDGISSFEMIQLGGVEQGVLIQAKDLTRPILIMLHGGPGLPLPGVSTRLSDAQLLEDFVLVYWDQRGCGKSYHPELTAKDLSLEQLVQDAGQLIDLMRHRFNVEKVFLGGISWGTVVGLSVAARFPEKIHAYIANGQIVDWTESDALGYQWSLTHARKLQNKQALKQLEKVGNPPYTQDFQQWGVLRNWLMRFGAYTYKEEGAKSGGFLDLLKILFRSPDYNFKDITRFLKGVRFSTESLLQDITTFNFRETIQQLEVPVYFFHGRHDQVIPGSLLEDFFLKLDAPQGKELIWLESSAHFTSREDTILFEKKVAQVSDQICG